ncbi:lantibiotic dehydratase [Streptomyces sp. NPDC059679]|uniref:lantibiotic dehydratase n=1 Tax=Streptomyces sp. NPDC059679 TaxID=3346903 RepID=UPI0036CD23BE
MNEIRWRPWDDIAVRSAGFPVQALLRLADAPTAALAMDPDTRPEQLRASWLRGMHRTVAELLDIVDADPFRAALLWQNPAALEVEREWLRRHPDTTARNRDRRRKEQTLTLYAQRYHARNETIGFFGPSVWTRFDDAVPNVSVRPGPQLVAHRAVLFEDWAIDVVGAALAENPGLRRWLPPARPPGTAVNGTLAVYPDGTAFRLSPGDAAVLAAVDGCRTARDIAVELRWRGTTEPVGEDDVLRALERLLDRDLIVWRPEVPVDQWPERALRDQLARLPDSDATAQARESLSQLVTARDDVAAAADQPGPLATALVRLDQLVAGLTGAPALRTRDERRFGRRAVFEDCARDVDILLGVGVRDALLPPLSLVLTSAGWLTWRFGERLAALIDELFSDFGNPDPEAEVPLGILVNQLQRRVADPTWAAPLVEELQKSWAGILAWPPDARRVHRETTELAGPVASAFRTPPPLWYGAGQHSPDIMIAAAGPEALRQGRFECVLGELHLAMATTDIHALTLTHPDAGRLLREAEAGLARRPRVVPAYPRSEKVSGRDYPPPELFSDRYWYLSFAPGTGGSGERAIPRGRRLVLDRLTARRVDGEVSVGLPSGERLRVLDIVAELTQESLVNLFRPLPRTAHTPRVTIGRLVIAREQWRVAAHRIPAPSPRDEAAAFGAMRRWAAGLGLPRFVFWRTAAAAKPVYLDLNSPLFVNNFLAAVRRARSLADSTVEITEMHPDPFHVWLPDAQGRLYTSELRLVVADRGGAPTGA